MIVACPSCHCKYSVQADLIGTEKLVRCAMCGTTWQQSACSDVNERKMRAFFFLKWVFFWFPVFVVIFSLLFARNAVVKIWPAAADFYDIMGIKNESSKKVFVFSNISNFFVLKNGALYMGLRGELANISNEIQLVPGIAISLRDDENVEKDNRYRRVWTHNSMYKKLLPSQKMVFETELQSVPYNNLVCDIKLETL
ncbi:MAG: zinc-ribbon domain-containing protein [Holosporaceae bacterium]|jgi:predicted Zn finger-like uncharacterized protein|nr:zinc-ribbon domain-containing protein [Holosporaceae bacterium]